MALLVAVYLFSYGPAWFLIEHSPSKRFWLAAYRVVYFPVDVICANWEPAREASHSYMSHWIDVRP